MIQALSLLTIVLLMAMQDATKKIWNRKLPGGVLVFSAGSTLCALVVFMTASGFVFDFHRSILSYSFAFAVCYAMGMVCSLLAIAEGPLAITSLIVSFSLIIPTFYGLFVLREKGSIFLYVGMLLLGVSLCLINVEKKGERKRLTWRWALYVILAFVGNGGCSTVQKIQIVNQGGAYKNEFMIVALVISFLILACFAWVREGKAMVIHAKKGVSLCGLCGLANGVVNLLVIYLSDGRIAASVLFPVISAGAILATFIISIVFFKEKLSRTQWLAFLCGLVSVVFLNL